MNRRAFLLAGGCLVCLLLIPVGADDKPTPVKGQRVFVAGHSFHMMIANPLGEIARAAGIQDHVLAGRQSIGGSRTLQHWDLADDKNVAKKTIRDGKVDVLTVSPHVRLPDEGIDKFTELLLEHNRDGRVLAQASWFPFDLPGKTGQNFKNADRDTIEIAELRKGYEPFYKALQEQTTALNQRHKRSVVFLVPVGHAVMALREQVVAGKVPGFTKQSELFTDSIGHSRAPIAALNAYCHFAVIYRKSPVGLPTSNLLGDAVKGEERDKLNRLLQEIAWEAVTKEPLSGVKTN